MVPWWVDTGGGVEVGHGVLLGRSLGAEPQDSVDGDASFGVAVVGEHGQRRGVGGDQCSGDGRGGFVGVICKGLQCV